MKVILIDDEMNFGELVQYAIRKDAPESIVDQQPTCDAGMMILKTTKFDLVLLDHKLATTETGFDCLKLIRQRYPDMPIVMLTGHPTDELIAQCKEAGADDFVKKEQMNELLSHTILSAMERREAKKKVVADVMASKEELRQIGDIDVN